MTPSDLQTVQTIWRGLTLAEQDALSRYLARAMQDAGVGDRRIRVRIMEALHNLDAEPLPVPA